MSNVVALKPRPAAALPASREYAVAQDQVQGLVVREIRGATGIGRSYLFRYRLFGQNVRLGIGSAKDLTEKQAVTEAQRFAAWLADGKDPKKERDGRIDVMANGPYTFKRAAEEWLTGHLPGLKNDKHKAQLQSRMRSFYPELGSLPMAAIKTKDVSAALRPMWVNTHATAEKMLPYLKAVFDMAIANERRPDGSNPVDKVKKLLPNVRRGRQRHMASRDWETLPEFWRELAGERGNGAEALRFATLTGQRTAQIINSTVDQFDLDRGLWLFEFEDADDMMKTDVAVHRVALGPVALQIVKDRIELVAGMHSETPVGKRQVFEMSNMTMLACLGNMGYWGKDVSEKDRVTTHGMRATFRSWYADNRIKIGLYDDKLAEAQLSHTGGKSAIDAAYQRSDLLVLRQKLMTAWEHFVATGEVISAVKN